MPQADSDFERSFADLAFATLRDKAPTLFDYLVGFQVLDVNEEQTHGVGVFGCKVGDEWVYLPVFFCNGELKGSELMYLKNQDMFVPLAENWTTYILNRKPYVLGEATSMSRSDIAKAPPDFTSFSYSPQNWNKSGNQAVYYGWRKGNKSGWVQPFVKACANWVVKRAADKALSQRLDLPTFLSNNGPTVTRTAIDLLTKHAELGETVFDRGYYTPQQLMVRDFTFDGRLMDVKIRREKTACDKGVGVDRLEATDKASNAKGIAKAPGSKGSLTKEASAIKVRYQLPGQLPRADKDGRDVFVSLMSSSDTDPDPAGLNSLHKTASDEKKVEKGKLDTKDLPWHKEKDTTPDVQVITRTDLDKDNYADVLSDKEKERLLKGEIVIKDNRTNASKVYRAEAPKTLTNITSTGVYRMLCVGGKLEDVLVVHAPKTIGTGTVEGACTAITLNKKIAVNTRPRALQVCESISSPLDWQKFLDKDCVKAESMSEDSAYVLLTPAGRGTIPFKVLKKRENPDGTTELWVKDLDGTRSFNSGDSYSPKDRCRITYPNKNYVSEYTYDDSGERKKNWTDGRHILINGKTGSLTNVGDTLFVPEGAYAFKINWEGYAGDDGFPKPGNPSDIEMYVMGNNLATPLKVHGDGTGEYEVSDTQEKKANLNRLQAVNHLMKVQGLRYSTADGLLKEADAKRGTRVLVQYGPGYPNHGHTKKAAPGDGDPYLGAGPSAPGQPEPVNGSDAMIAAQVQEPMTTRQQVPDMLPQQSNRQLYNPDPRLDQQPYQLAQDAAQSGSKDIFDAGMVGSLIQTTDSDALIDKYLGDMFLGMDRVGRTLFLLYQHNDQFRNRYGQEELQGIEDGLKSQFKGLGDLVLNLKQKTVEPDPGQDPTNIDMSESDGSASMSSSH